MKVQDLILSDNPSSLFSLRTNTIAAQLAGKAIEETIHTKILDKNDSTFSFAQAAVGYALKDSLHTRKVLVLDPYSTYYFYDFMLNNKKQFIVPKAGPRQSFGYFLENNGEMISGVEQHRSFKKRQHELSLKYKYYAQVDIANCFNNFYHHDVSSYVTSAFSQNSGQEVGQFLREINGGISVNCFPQGIFPAKALGNKYLSFTEQSRRLQSAEIIRFMDDYFFFDNKETTIHNDILALQELLGEHHLSLNATKTKIGDTSEIEQNKIDAIMKSLLAKRQSVKSYLDPFVQTDVCLEDSEAEYLKELIREPTVSEEDVELALSLLREDPDEALILSNLVLTQYPNLIKSLYWQVLHLPKQISLEQEFTSHLENKILSEFELFWLARIVIDHFEMDDKAASLLWKIEAHPGAGTIVKAAIAESPLLEFGFAEHKRSILRDNSEGVLSYASAVGLLGCEKGQRNQQYKYAMKNSPKLRVFLAELSNSK